MMEQSLQHCRYLNDAIALFPELTATNNQSTQDIIALYNKLISLIEESIWQDGFSEAKLLFFQNLCKEFETHSLAIKNNRHEIIVVIPVADRPQHLKMCLQSILSLCELFCYGGKEKYYNKVSILIAEDSRFTENIAKNQQIIRAFNKKGLKVSYFGLDEQKKIVSGLSDDQSKQLKNIIGEPSLNGYSHKGASITRNITYLKLQKMVKNKNNDDKYLFYFIDSDQEFKINAVKNGIESSAFTINYFYYLDKIFSENDIAVLTGKVVGDPPVSPSVMAANFIDDINHFFSEMINSAPDAECGFHHHNDKNKGSDSAYHDMASLFGFDKKESLFNYQCTLEGAHNNSDCFIDFSRKLNSFFDGVHLTRKIVYQYQNIVGSIVPARTIYTGNYIFTEDALQYFIPFASLKLRMAGPTMGRFIKKYFGAKFVSANLPMLHGRIVEADGQSEYRPGIDHISEVISLSGEFERQFYGDVMLFSVEKILESDEPLTIKIVTDTVIKTELFLRKLYLEKLQLVNTNVEKLQASLLSKQAWWDNNPLTTMAVAETKRFINNIEQNFGEKSSAMELINDNNKKSERTISIIDAIMQFDADKTAWQKLMAS